MAKAGKFQEIPLQIFLFFKMQKTINKRFVYLLHITYFAFYKTIVIAFPDFNFVYN